MALNQNPYATNDGGPKDGQFDDWWAWEQNREQDRRNALTPEALALEDQEVRQIQRRRAAELS